MADHLCGPPYPPKRSGRCLCCARDVYEVKEVWPEGHPLAGAARRVGAMLDHATQAEFLLSDGSEASITFCLDCAAAIQPEHYAAVWGACVEHLDLVLRLAGRSENERKTAVAAQQRVWPVAFVRKRREGPMPGFLVVDRR